MPFDEILSLIPCAVFWKDRLGRFQGCNPRFLEIVGMHDPENLVGKTDQDLPWAASFEDCHQDDQKVMITGETITRVKKIKIATREITVHTSKTPWVKNGEVLGIVGAVYNLTEYTDQMKAECLEKCSSEKNANEIALENIIACLPGYVYWLDKNNVFLGCNDAEAKAAGFTSREEVIGKTNYDMPWREQAEAFNRVNNEVMQTGREYSVEEFCVLADGSGQTHFSKKTPLRHNGEIIGTLGISFDITHHKDLEKQLESQKNTAEMALENIIACLPGYVYWLDKNNVFLGCNDAEAKAAGLASRHEIIGKTYYDLPPWSDRAEAFNSVNNEVMRTGQECSVEEKSMLPDGREGTFLSKKIPLRRNDEIIGTLGISFDITHQKELEEQLRIANELKTQFIQNMQHDIRTPASGVWSILDDAVKEENDPHKKKRLILARNSSKELLNICNEVIDFEKIIHDDSPLRLKKINIHHLIQSIIELNQSAAFVRGLELRSTIEAQVPHIVKGDSHRVSRILVNLVGNAIKFTKQGSISIHVKLMSSKRQRIIIQFEIQDTGVGIPEDKKEFIYEKFNRLTQSNEGYYKGSGLGLHIVKQYVTELEGEIDVHSEMGVGTSFYVSLPFEQPLVAEVYDEDEFVADHETANDTMVDPQKASSLCVGKHILLIEDDALARMAAMNTLKSAGYQVKTADTVSKALQILKADVFDLIISDLGLPDGSGMEIVRTIKINPQSINYSTPFLALTAHNDQQKKAEAEQAGFSGVMTKPLKNNKFNHIIDTCLRGERPVHISPAETLEPLEELKIIDIEFTKQYTDGNEQIALELLDMLCTELPLDVQHVKEAHVAGDVKILRDLLHKIAGGFCYCGVPRLNHATQRLHEAIKSQPLTELNEFFNDFYVEAGALLKEHKNLTRSNF